MTRDIGVLWENAALAHLQEAGLRSLVRNFNCRYGEIDLIMRDSDCTVFVEVRYRNTAARGGGLGSVGSAKRRKLVRTAAVFLQANPRLAGGACRFDVIACAGTPAQPQFEWIRAAFDTE